jgi:hypothetical protein
VDCLIILMEVNPTKITKSTNMVLTRYCIYISPFQCGPGLERPPQY